MADATTTAPQTNPTATGGKTTEGKMAFLTIGVTILAAVIPTLLTMLTDLSTKFPSWSWTGPAIGIVGVIGTILTAMGYMKSRTAVKVALIESGNGKST